MVNNSCISILFSQYYHGEGCILAFFSQITGLDIFGMDSSVGLAIKGMCNIGFAWRVNSTLGVLSRKRIMRKHTPSLFSIAMFCISPRTLAKLWWV
jgi:hypothetical protein